MAKDQKLPRLLSYLLFHSSLHPLLLRLHYMDVNFLAKMVKNVSMEHQNVMENQTVQMDQMKKIVISQTVMVFGV